MGLTRTLFPRRPRGLRRLVRYLSVLAAVGYAAESRRLRVYLSLRGNSSSAYLIATLTPRTGAPTRALPRIRCPSKSARPTISPRGSARAQSERPSRRRHGAHHPDAGPAGRWPQVGASPLGCIVSPGFGEAGVGLRCLNRLTSLAPRAARDVTEHSEERGFCRDRVCCPPRHGVRQLSSSRLYSKGIEILCLQSSVWRSLFQKQLSTCLLNT